jgi:phosphatidate phosphatase APP1
METREQDVTGMEATGYRHAFPRLRKLFILAAAIGIVCVHGAALFPRETDDEIMFFPTIARSTGNTVAVDIHGWVYEPELSSVKRRVFIKEMSDLLDLAEGSGEHALFNSRIRYFLADNERKKSITIQIGGKRHVLEKSRENGHFSSRVVLDDPRTVASIKRNGLVRFSLVQDDPGADPVAGMAWYTGPRGVSVISDIDDTIKISDVLNKKEMLKNTFIRKYEPVPGMAGLYRRWAGRGAAFHYLSGSPWQLFPALSAFMKEYGYPGGSMQFKNFRIKDSSMYSFLTADQSAYKTVAIQTLLDAFPGRRFILAGDSGETDPEVYTSLARIYKKQVIAVCIRDIGNLTGDPRRCEKLRAGIAPEKLHIFMDAKELDGITIPR